MNSIIMPFAVIPLVILILLVLIGMIHSGSINNSILKGHKKELLAENDKLKTEKISLEKFWESEINNKMSETQKEKMELNTRILNQAQWIKELEEKLKNISNSLRDIQETNGL